MKKSGNDQSSTIHFLLQNRAKRSQIMFKIRPKITTDGMGVMVYLFSYMGFEGYSKGKQLLTIEGVKSGIVLNCLALKLPAFLSDRPYIFSFFSFKRTLIICVYKCTTVFNVFFSQKDLQVITFIIIYID